MQQPTWSLIRKRGWEEGKLAGARSNAVDELYGAVGVSRAPEQSLAAVQRCASEFEAGEKRIVFASSFSSTALTCSMGVGRTRTTATDPQRTTLSASQLPIALSTAPPPSPSSPCTTSSPCNRLRHRPALLLDPATTACSSLATLAANLRD